MADSENPNAFDLPLPSQSGVDEVSREVQPNDRQVMGAQIADARTPLLLNGTYGAVQSAGPMSMDDEVQVPVSRLETQAGGESERTVTGGETGVGTLRAAAGRVMANVAAKMQGVLPPGKPSAAQSFLSREDTGSAGTQGTGYVTAGSVQQGEQSGSEARVASGGGLFSPQQARRLQEMETEAPPSMQMEIEKISIKLRDQVRQLRNYLILRAQSQERTARSSGDSDSCPVCTRFTYSASCVSSGAGSECWQTVLAEAQEWYNNKFVPATPIARVRLKIPESSIDRDPRWSRVRHRMEHLIIQCCPEGVRTELSSARVCGVMNLLCRLYIIYKPGGVAERAEALRQVQHPRPADSAIDAVLRLRTWKRWMTRLSDLGGAQPDAALSIQALENITSNVLKSLPSLAFRINLVRASLHLDTQPTVGKVGEYYEHLLVELEAVSRVAEGSSGGSGANKPETTKGVRQVDARSPNGGEATTPSAKDNRAAKAPGAAPTSESPKRLCKWFHEGKGCRRGKDCRFLHDWSQIPKPERADRCMMCGGKGHRKDACPVSQGNSQAKRDDGASSAKAMRGEPSPKAKGNDPGLRKVLSDAAGVLREALSGAVPQGEFSAASTTGSGASPGTGEVGQGTGSEQPPMAAAAKIQAQLEDLEARVLDGGARVRAVNIKPQLEHEGPTALLDSGATHAVLDDASVEKENLVPCTVSLAGDQRQTWRQTPGGSLVAPATEEGHAPQTILPLGCLVDKLGCSVRWSKKGGLQLVHPRLGRLRTSLKSGCPQLSKEQALVLVKELEGVRLGELSGRLKKVKAHLKAAEGLQVDKVLDDFVSSGSYESSVALVKVCPFAKNTPSRIVNQLAVDLQNASGWELLKGLPFNRRIRKRLHESRSWVLHLGAGVVDPVLRQLCRERGLELVVISTSDSERLTPDVWKAVAWASFTGRVNGVVAEATMRTWSGVKDEGNTVHARDERDFWGKPSNDAGLQAKVDSDSLIALQPMWLWTLASIAQGEGVPFCQTFSEHASEATQSWLDRVAKPFAQWSNCSQFHVAEVKEATFNSRPMTVVSNLGFPSDGIRSVQPATTKDTGSRHSVWPSAFRREVSLALFGCATAQLNQDSEVVVEDHTNSDGQPGCEDLEQPVACAVNSPSKVDKSSEGAGSTGTGLPEVEPRVLEEVKGDASGAQEEPVPKRAKLSDKERQRWRRHIAAHHIPFRKDCLQCVMSGALGVQHRRVKCPQMFALAFDLAGPFKEKGRDDKGSGYKYALVAGLRVPELALPLREGREVTKHHRNTPVKPLPTPLPAGQTVVPPDDDASSEASWLKADLEPTRTVNKVDGETSESEEEQGSEPGWFEVPDVDGIVDGVPDENGAEAGGASLDGDDSLPQPSQEGDPWDDQQGVENLTDEAFDEELSKMVFSGANQTLRFVVPLKSRQGPQILAGLQEVVTECNRLGYPVKVAHTDRAKELMSKATMDWLQAKLIQPSFTQGDDPKSNGLAERLVGWVKARARCVEDLVDPEAEFEDDSALQAEPVDDEPSDLIESQAYNPDDCGRLLELAFGNTVGLRGITRASAAHPSSKNYAVQVSTRQMWLEAQAQEETGRTGMSVRYARMTGQEWADLCELDEEDFERGFSRWQRVLGGHDEDPAVDPLSASIPHHLFMATVFQQRNWSRDPELYLPTADGLRLLAYVYEFSDDGYVDDSPFPDRMLMFSIRDMIRDVVEMVILRVELIHEPVPQEEMQDPVLRAPGPGPPEVRAITGPTSRSGEVIPNDEVPRLPFPLPNPTFIKYRADSVRDNPADNAAVFKTEATTTQNLEGLLSSLSEPLSVTHTASQEEVRSHLDRWRPAIEKELKSLKGQGVLVSHFGKEAKAMMANPDTSVISLKGVFTAKATHVDADSLYAAGAPAELVRAALALASRYLLRPPRWLVDLGLAQADEYYSLGMVLYGFKEAPAWWSDHRHARLTTAEFLGCHLEQGRSDPSIWRIMKGSTLQGYLVTYVDDFLILSDRKTAGALHQWLLDVAGWETDGLSEASPGVPVRFLGMQLHGYEDGHFSLDQEAYVDELVRAYGLKEGDKSRIVCPRELLMNEGAEIQPFDEATTRAAQKVAGECLWLAQRSRIDICFATTVLCSRVSKDPHGALAIGRRILCYLHYSKDFRLHLLPDDSDSIRLEVRGFKIKQLMQSGWTVKHCPGQWQKADLLTKVLSSVRSRKRKKKDRRGSGVPIEWPWELAALTLLVVLSTLFVWEASGAPCRRRNDEGPKIRAVTTQRQERRNRQLQERVAAAIDSALSESPTGDEGVTRRRKGKNKCLPEYHYECDASAGSSPTVVYGDLNMHVPVAGDVGRAPATYALQPADFVGGVPSPVTRSTSSTTAVSQATQTDPVVVLDPGEYVYISGRGDCVHRDQECRGLRRAGVVNAKAVCQYCLKGRNF
ncbi:GIP [Symbiodinium sp. CCMP2456]|nr:GIP [Symbiodinium sp. CCMP2456]